MSSRRICGALVVTEAGRGNETQTMGSLQHEKSVCLHYSHFLLRTQPIIAYIYPEATRAKK
jgi:hypothetical protein